MAEHGPLVSVYVVNHNYGHFISRALDSLRVQTMRDFEVIVIDDGSTDDSRNVIETYRDTDNLFIVYQRNKGLNVTNNIAMRMARGQFIMRLDADDYLDPHALEILSGTLQRHPDIGLVFPDYYLVDEQENILEVVRRHDFSEVTLLDQPAHGACTMVRKALLEELDGYDESFRCQDGYDLWVRFIEHFAVKNVNLPLFYYRQHGASLTRNEARILNTRGEILKKQAVRGGRRLQSVAVVPVRDARTDPRSIALRPLGDRLTIDWTLDAALAAERISSVILTTPDTAILDHVRHRYEGRVVCVQRDRTMAQLNSFTRASVFQAVQQASDQLHSPLPDAVVELFVEAPFRTPQMIDTALDLLEVFDSDRVISVRPEFSDFYRHSGDGLVPLRSSRSLRLESEDLFREVGVVSATRLGCMESEDAFDRARLGHMVVDQRDGFRIHSEWDWDIACAEAAKMAGKTA